MNLSDTQTQTLLTADLSPVRVTGKTRPGPVLVICEHASPAIPDQMADLGLAPAHRNSHAVWDIGAGSLADRVAARLGAPLCVAGVSRLVIDLNRPPDAPDSMPDLVETIPVPGNLSLTRSERQARADAIYHPFHDTVGEMLDAMSGPVLVTVHSFTPVWNGQARATRIGLLHDADPTLALAMHARAGEGAHVDLNRPYSAADGVTHTLARHGTGRGIPNVMIEVRSDLLCNDAAVDRIAGDLVAMLVPALEQVA